MINDTEKHHDVVIVGAGPAGSSAAIRLASFGLDVGLVEQKQFPREKLCGEFISPECLGHFEELGVMPAIDRSAGTELLETVFYARNGRHLAVRSEWFGNGERSALGLSRAEMDDLLLQAARGAGAVVYEGSNASGLVVEGQTVKGIKIKKTKGADLVLRAGLTIDATGRTRSLARRLDDQNGQKTKLKAAEHVAFKTHMTGASVAAGACEIYVYSGGYGGCNRVENDLYNLCFIASAEDTKRLGSDADRVLHEVVFANSRAAAAMKDARVVKPWHAVPIQRFGRGSLVPADGLLTIGDAAAFIDPFTGSGILLALESARIAADAITRYFDAGSNIDSLTEDYQREYAAKFDRRLRMCSMLRHAAFVPWLAESLIIGLGFSNGLLRRVAQATR